MLTATKQWFTLPVLILCYCFVCTQANSGSVCKKKLYYIITTVKHAISVIDARVGSDNPARKIEYHSIPGDKL